MDDLHSLVVKNHDHKLTRSKINPFVCDSFHFRNFIKEATMCAHQPWNTLYTVFTGIWILESVRDYRSETFAEKNWKDLEFYLTFRRAIWKNIYIAIGRGITKIGFSWRTHESSRRNFENGELYQLWIKSASLSTASEITDIDGVKF